MGDPYGARKLAWVPPFTGSTIKYGFMTNAAAAVSTALGHTIIAPGAAKPTGLVVGANAPKPWKVTRLRADGSDSSFVAPASIATAIAAGYKVTSRGKVRVGSASARSRAVYVLYEGNKLAWRMPNYSFSRIPAADLTALGVLPATSTDLDMVFGASYPALPRVAATLGTAPNLVRVSTFCDPDALDALPTGWAPVKASTEYVAP